MLPDTASPLVYVVTLNWNRVEDTLTCLASLRRLAYARFRILVVDNGSTGGSVQRIHQQFPDVEQIENRRNLGFAAGANTGIRYALRQGADYVFLINNDTLVAPAALDLLVDAALTWDAALVAPKILYAAHPPRIWSVGARRQRITQEISGCRRGEQDVGLDGTPFEVDFVTACAVLMRRQCLEETGLFDERFFMYYEDSDYCLRARAVGYRLMVVPQAVVWHCVAASTGGSDSPDERYHMALSSVRFFRKHTRGWRWAVVAPYRTGSALKTLLRLLAAGRRDSALAYARGLLHGFR